MNRDLEREGGRRQGGWGQVSEGVGSLDVELVHFPIFHDALQSIAIHQHSRFLERIPVDEEEIR